MLLVSHAAPSALCPCQRCRQCCPHAARRAATSLCWLSACQFPAHDRVQCESVPESRRCVGGTAEKQGRSCHRVCSCSTDVTFQLPCNSGHTLDTVEADEIVQQAIDALTDLPSDALAVIVWTLGNLLDSLSKACLVICHEIGPSLVCSRQMNTVTFPSKLCNLSYSYSRSSRLILLLDSLLASAQAHQSTLPPCPSTLKLTLSQKSRRHLSKNAACDMF